MPTNVFIARWNGGWHEVVDAASIAAFGRYEAMLSLGAQQSVEETTRVAEHELETFAQLREQSTLEHAPISISEAPYVAYGPADRLTAPDFYGTPTLFRVAAMTVAEDDDGVLAFVPIIGDSTVELEFEDHLALDIVKMTPGTLGGRSRSASPFAAA